MPAESPTNSRLFMLIYDVGSMTLRHVFVKKAVENGGTDIYDFLYKNNAEYSNWNKYQRPQITIEQISAPATMDVTSLCKIISHFFKHKQQSDGRSRLNERETEAVEIIHKARNKIAHICDTRTCDLGCPLSACTHNFYLKLWTNTISAITGLFNGLDSNQIEAIEEAKAKVTERDIDVCISLESEGRLREVGDEIKELMHTCRALDEQFAASTPAEVVTRLSAMSTKLEQTLERVTKDREYEKTLPENKTLGIKLVVRSSTGEAVSDFADTLLTVIQAITRKDPNIRSSKELLAAVDLLMKSVQAEHGVSSVEGRYGSVILAIDTKSCTGILNLIQNLQTEFAKEILQDISRALSKDIGQTVTIDAELEENSVADITEALGKTDIDADKMLDLSHIDQCKFHPENHYTYYCEGHDELACETCVHESHLVCKTVTPISEMLTKMDVDASLKTARDLKDKLRTIKQKTNHAFKEIKKTEKDGENYLSSLRDDLEAKLKLEKRKLAEERFQERIKSNQFLLEQEKKIKTVEESEKALESVRQQHDSTKSFIQMHKSKEDIREVEKDIKIIEKKAEELTLNIVPVRPYKEAKDISELPSKINQLHRKKTVSLKLLSDVDLDGSWISGCVVLKDDSCVLCDRLGSRLIVLTRSRNIDDPSWYVSTTLDVDSPPYNITKFTGITFLMTVPQDKLYMVVSVDYTTSSLLVEQTVETVDKCYGITSFQGKIYVSCHNNKTGGSIEVRSQDRGYLINKYQTPFLTWPMDIRIGKFRNKTVLCVCDFEEDKVCFLSLEGVLLRTFTMAGGPSELSVDDNGTLLVCENTEHKVRAIYQDGTSDDVILDDSDGLRNPTSIAYQQSSGILVVGMLDTCKVYERSELTSEMSKYIKAY